MKKKYRHKKIVQEISDETGLNVKVINLIIRKFYKGMKILLLRNEQINIKGFFRLVLTSHYKKKLKKLGKDTNLRPRKNKKRYYVKKVQKK